MTAVAEHFYIIVSLFNLKSPILYGLTCYVIILIYQINIREILKTNYNKEYTNKK